MNNRLPHCRPGTTDAMQRLADENEALRKALSDDQMAKTMMTELNLRDGGINMSIEGGVSAVLVNCFADQFKQVGGKNYVEMNFHHQEVGPMTVTLQRKEGKTPGELRAEALTENEALRAERDEINSWCNRLHEAGMKVTNKKSPSGGYLVLTVDLDSLKEVLIETSTQSLAHIRAEGAREALERATKVHGFSGTVVRVDVMREIIGKMEGES